MDRLYIIGNGFDIDLGMDTRYSDFLGSTKFKEFAEDRLVTDFANYLLNQNREYWVDMETAIKNYVNDNDIVSILIDKRRLSKKIGAILVSISNVL